MGQLGSRKNKKVKGKGVRRKNKEMISCGLT